MLRPSEGGRGNVTTALFNFDFFSTTTMMVVVEPQITAVQGEVL